MIAVECTAMDTSQPYDDLAPYYHLIYENWETSIIRQSATISAVLRKECGLTNTARILDCACGIGTQALGLAKAGFRVTGCDVSPRAVERAQTEASRRGLDIQFCVANMLDLASLEEARFDAAICIDNALPHLESHEQLGQAAEQMRSRLRTGGSLIASVRDYDHLGEQRPVLQGPSFYSDDGRRRIVFQIWDWLDDSRYVFHLYITREATSGWDTFHTCGEYRAFRKDEVATALRRAQFKNIRWLSQDESGFYQPIVLAEVD